MKIKMLCSIALTVIMQSGLAQDNGSDVYTSRCFGCHENPAAGQAHPPPPRTELAKIASNTIYNALSQGVMRMQATGLTETQMKQVAEFLTGKPVEQPPLEITTNVCKDNPPMKDPSLSPGWSGWGPDFHNTRAALNGGINAANVSRLRLKWVYGLPGEDQPRSQPAIADGRLYVGSKAGALYSVDAKSGCTYWTYISRNGIRSAISVAPITHADGSKGFAAYFIDLRANVYAIDAQSGKELWVTRTEMHPGVRATGSVTYYDGNLYVPAAGVVEETSSSGANYGCCTFRGSITKVNANTGEVVWKTYTTDEPQQRGVSDEGVPLFGPSGAGIWSAPTIDTERGLLYTATGNAYGDPAPVTSDAVLAMSLETGEIVWVNQVTPGDAFIGGCDNSDSPNCPDELGPDFDFSASPIQVKAGGKDLLIIPQKSGMVYALDAANEGKVVWEYRVNAGSRSGGFWGMSIVDGVAFAAAGGYTDPKSGGIHGIDIATGKARWVTPPQDMLCQQGPGCRATQSAAVTGIPGAVFSGAADGGMRAYSAVDGKVLWTFDSNPEFETINGVKAAGGSFDASGPVVVDGMVYLLSGNCCIVGRPGNALFAFELESK